MKRRFRFGSMRPLGVVGLLCSSVLCCLGVLCWSGTESLAHAQSAPSAEGDNPTQASGAYPPCEGVPDERAMAAAKGAFEAGNAAFNEADYPRAINYWEDAYRRDCTAHPMLRNLARAYELDGQYAKAIAALETFLARQPNANEDPTTARRIEALRKKLEETEAAEAAPPPAEPEEPVQAAPPSPPPIAPARKERSLVPLYVAGGGAIVGIVGGVLWYPAYSTVQEIAEECPDRGRTMPCPRKEEGNQARSDVTLWGIVGGVGAAVAVGGVVWYFAQSEEPEAAALSVEAGPGYAGVRYSTTLAF